MLSSTRRRIVATALFLVQFLGAPPLALAAAPVDDVCWHRKLPFFCSCNDEPDFTELICTFKTNMTKADSDSPAWDAFASQPRAKKLDFNCRATHAFIPNKVFSQFSSGLLENFKIRGCDIDTLDSQTFVGQPSLVNLREIDLELNEITRLEPKAISNLASLKLLLLGKNQIERFPKGVLDSLVALEELCLDSNGLRTIEDFAFQELPNLKKLILNTNFLQTVSELMFAGLENVLDIDLFNNQIEELPDFAFRQTPLLRQLAINQNSIARIAPHAFDGLRHLHILQLEKNHLTTLSGHLFASTPGLINIRFSDNQLEWMDKNVLSDLPLATDPVFSLVMKDNPWTCSCNLLWMASFYEKVANNETRKELRHTTCRAPGLGEPNALHLPVGAKLHVIRDLATNLSISDKCDDLETSIWSDGGDENALDNSNVLEQHRLANVADSARRFESPSILILSLFLFSIPLTVNFSPR